MSKVPLHKLNTGALMPSVGLGCWMGYAGGGKDTEKMVETALKVGYRHFDTAMGYGNEEAVGNAIRASGIPREEIFVTTKLPGEYHDRVQEGFEASLKALDIGYIDLFLMHWPQAIRDGQKISPDESPTFVETWLDMEKLVDTGKVKSLGVSNFSVQNLEKLLAKAKIVPADNQVELHPCHPDHELLEYSKSKGIHLTAYCPLGQYESPFFEDPALLSIAKRNEKTVSQVVLSWAVQRGTAVVPKSANEGRMKQNLDVFTLSPEDFKAVDEYYKSPGMWKRLCAYGPAGTFVKPDNIGKETVLAGWRMADLGWNVNHHGPIAQSQVAM